MERDDRDAREPFDRDPLAAPRLATPRAPERVALPSPVTERMPHRADALPASAADAPLRQATSSRPSRRPPGATPPARERVHRRVKPVPTPDEQDRLSPPRDHEHHGDHGHRLLGRDSRDGFLASRRRGGTLG